MDMRQTSFTALLLTNYLKSTCRQWTSASWRMLGAEQSDKGPGFQDMSAEDEIKATCPQL
jgi:hypothetical protein